jgi:hypothetical protein
MPEAPRARKRRKRKGKKYKASVPRTLGNNTNLYKYKAVMTPLPSTQKVMLKYSDFLSFTPNGAPTNYIYSCNNLYDPNVTGVGHQPRGFDQLMALYDHFVVISAVAEVTFYNGTALPMVCGLMIDDNARS